MKTVKPLLNLLISAIYPDKCICCGEILDEGHCICDNCEVNIERTNLDDICLECGLQKDYCVCKYNIYRFTSLICVFNNVGLARSAYYSYKFGKKQHYVNFFAKELSQAIKYCYGNTHFDLVCAVPSFRKYGYDHSGYIAKAVAKKLNLPFDSRLLRCLKKTKKQHKSTTAERLTNVDGKYSASYCVDNKKILLIDDIKTTGATLDECAKELLFAGADSVRCVAVLGAVTNKTKIEK